MLTYNYNVCLPCGVASNSSYITLALCWLLFAAMMGHVLAQGDPLTSQQPVPKMQAIPQVNGTSFQWQGKELTSLHYSPTQRRVFLFPILTSSDVSLTRIGHPHDPWGHSHHNSVWISHFDVDGVDFWGDHGKKAGTIVLHQIPRDAYTDSDTSASMRWINHWNSDNGNQTLLIEERTVEVRPIDGPKSWWLLIDCEFTAPKGKETVLGPTAFGMAAVRMAKSIGVRDGGGRILNSEGNVNEKEVFRKPAKWCDYSGRISNSPDGLAGITLMNHPTNPSHPAPFHVRDDGWMGACLNLDAPISVSSDKPLRLRYGYWVHEGLPSLTQIESRWQEFAALRVPSK